MVIAGAAAAAALQGDWCALLLLLLRQLLSGVLPFRSTSAKHSISLYFECLAIELSPHWAARLQQ
jgi:hypothetical protein